MQGEETSPQVFSPVPRFRSRTCSTALTHSPHHHPLPFPSRSWHWESKSFNKIAEDAGASLRSYDVVDFRGDPIESSTASPPHTPTPTRIHPRPPAVRSRLLSIVVDDGKYAVRVSEVSRLKAEASVVIRKGKKLPIFDISFGAKWEGKSILGAAKVSTGELAVTDLMPDDINDDFPVRVSQSNAVAVEVDAVSKVLAGGPLVKEVRRHMREFVEQLVNLDGGPETLAADAARRAEEKAKTERALLEKAAEKDKIAREQAEKEKKRKDEEAAKAKEREKERGKAAPASSSGETGARPGGEAGAAASAAPSAGPVGAGGGKAGPAPSSPLAATAASLAAGPPGGASGGGATSVSKPSAASNAAPAPKASKSKDESDASTTMAVEHTVNLEGKVAPAGNAPSAKASVWNAGAWQWEEKEFTPWAKARLNELLAGIDVDIPGGHAKVVEVPEVKGDATINIRKVSRGRAEDAGGC
jgi:activator of HSP90 ATPase